MPIIEYFLLALLGWTPSTPAPEAPTKPSIITLGEDVLVQPTAGVPDAGGGQKKPGVKRDFVIKKTNRKVSHHPRRQKNGISSVKGKGSHVKPDALVIKQKLHQ